MNLYDFDNTIYDGESTVDFFLFCLKKKKSLIKYLPIIVYTGLLYEFRVLSIDKLIQIVNKMSKAFYGNQEDFSNLVKEFWVLHEKKLKQYYMSKISENDVIITASPYFLINEITSKLNTQNIIASSFNTKTGELEFACFRENKVVAFKKKFPNKKIANFYTDSFNDVALINLSEKSFLVKKNKKEKLIDKSTLK